MKFKSENYFEKRLQESTIILTKYPNKIPIIYEKTNENKSDLPTLDKKNI